ncbi:hypothetical protein KA405_04890, partial [Patescibacteria group bacterium]|nr:hypothetical protein [Patescibacteria group bacterium]
GFVNESNIKSKITNIHAREIANHVHTALNNSAFSCPSPPLSTLIPSGSCNVSIYASNLF